MTFITVLFGLLALVAVWLLRRGHLWAKPVALISALFAIGLTGAATFRTATPTMVDWQDRFERGFYASGLVMGEKLAERFPEGRIAVLLRPLAEGERGLNAHENARFKGLQNGLGGQRTVDLIHLPFGGDLQHRYSDPMLYQTMLASGELRLAMNNVINGYDVIVLGSDFPAAWDQPDLLRGPFALAAFDIPDSLAQSLIQTGLLELVVTPREDSTRAIWDNLPSNPRALFARLYHLLDSNAQ